MKLFKIPPTSFSYLASERYSHSTKGFSKFETLINVDIIIVDKRTYLLSRKIWPILIYIANKFGLKPPKSNLKRFEYTFFFVIFDRLSA